METSEVPGYAGLPQSRVTMNPDDRELPPWGGHPSGKRTTNEGNKRRSARNGKKRRRRTKTKSMIEEERGGKKEDKMAALRAGSPSGWTPLSRYMY